MEFNIIISCNGGRSVPNSAMNASACGVISLHFVAKVGIYAHTVEPLVVNTSPQPPVFQNTKSFSVKSLHWEPLVSDHLS